MKILMIGDSVYPDTMGGSHRHIYDISSILVNQGHEVIVYSPKTSHNGDDKEVINDIIIRRYFKSKNKVLSFCTFLIGPFILFKNDIKNGFFPDVIHGHWPLTVLLIFLYIKIKRLPIRLVYTFHGPAYEEYKIELSKSVILKYPFLLFLRIIEQCVLNLSDVISTASYYMRSKASKLYGNIDKIFVNYLFVDLDKFSISKSSDLDFKFECNKKYVFVIRRLKKRMGIQLLIEAFSHVQKVHPECELLIAGKGDYKVELEKLTASLSLENKVHFLGFLPDDQLKYYYSNSNVCIVPSQDLEGFGLTTAESMACGTPVVATNVCANPEILHNITPELLSEYNAIDLADKINIALDNMYDSNKLREYVITHFNSVNTINNYVKLYKGELN